MLPSQKRLQKILKTFARDPKNDDMVETMNEDNFTIALNEHGENPDLPTIDNDLNRIYFQYSKVKSDEMKLNVIKNLLFELFKTLEIKYYQGMTEIAGVLVEAYFADDVDKLMLVNEEGDQQNTKTEDTVYQIRNSYKFRNEENIKTYSAFVKSHEKGINELKVILTNIFREKYFKLVEDNFSTYKKYNEAFVKLMNERNVKIDELGALKYMNRTLTYFSRNLANSDSAFQVFCIILQSDTSILFSILAVLYDDLSLDSATMTAGEPLMKTLPSNFIEQILKTHTQFKEVFANLGRKKQSSFLAIGAAVSVVALGVAVAYRNRKQDK